MNTKIITAIVACFAFASCSADLATTPKGTGAYPNSAYVSTVSKDIPSATFGNSSSKIQIKIFSDYQCPACIGFHKNIEEKIWTDYIATGKVAVTFFNYPLTFSTAAGRPLHVNAEGDALASFCGLSQGKFHEYRNALYDLEDVKKGAVITDEERVAAAKKIGMDGDQLSLCLSQAWYQKALEKEIAQGNTLGVEGTPSVFINNAPVNYKNSEEFFKILDATLQE